MQSDPDSYNGCMDDMPKLAQTIDQVVAGRTELYEAIVRYYEGFVFSVAVRVTFDRDLAYDVTQDTFLKLYGSLSKFRGQSRLSSYLYRIATNAGIDAARKRSQHPVSSGDAQADLLTVEAPQTASDGPDVEEVKSALHAALQKVDPVFRAAFALVDLDGLSYEDAAFRLGVPVGTVKSRVFRARGQLRELLSGTLGRRVRLRDGDK
jgi:RNA polymerase sigma-70 factor (ECF subfamily)